MFLHHRLLSFEDIEIGDHQKMRYAVLHISHTKLRIVWLILVDSIGQFV